MAASQKYFHDHLVLLLLSINTVLAFLASLFVLLRLSSGHGNGYIVQCRNCSDVASIKFTNGSVVELLAFIGFALAVLAIHTILSIRTYQIHRLLSVTILSLGVLLLVLTIVVSNALLVLH